MKKALMVLSFALCASLAFAQTAKVSRGLAPAHHERAAVKISDMKAPVNYKASIFTKDAESDTARLFDFSSAEGMNIGVVSAEDVINGTVVTSQQIHTQTGETSKWMRWSDSATCAASADNLFPNKKGIIKNYVVEYMGATNNGSDNGFYMVVFDAERASVRHSYDTWLEFPAVQKSPNACLIDVRLSQCYIKYYDQCFVDYKIGNAWKSVEINITGVDCEVNGIAPYRVSFPMPQELVNEANVTIRLRAYSYGRGNTYGQAWAVDNVAICNVFADKRMRITSHHAFDGFYGQIPQGMSIPMSYAVNARNHGIVPLTNAHLTLATGTDRNNLGNPIDGPTVDIPATNVNTPYNLVINERGFMQADSTDLENVHQGDLTTLPNYGTTGLAGGQGRSLPVAQVGKNFYNISATSGTLTKHFDTVAYNVTGYTEGDGLVPGFRWSRDNGVIPSRAIFCYQHTDPDQDGDTYITDDYEENIHFTQPGYRVNMRYVSGADVPEGWVFRGLEIIPATLSYIDTNMSGAQLIPIAAEEANWYYDGRYIYFGSNNLAVGLDNRVITVSGNDGNSSITRYGTIAPGDEYNSIQIQFLDQPEIKPNTAYRFGYILNNEKPFAAAAQKSWSVTSDDTGGLWRSSYARIPEVADYQAQVYPMTWQDVMVYDNTVQDYIFGWNIDEYPMIRPIVGPRQDLPSVRVSLTAPGSDNGGDTVIRYEHGTNTYTHDAIINCAVGSTHYLYIYGGNDHMVVDSIFLNGVYVQPWDDETETGDDNLQMGQDNVTVTVGGEEHVVLYRPFYRYFFDFSNAIAGSNINVSAAAHWEEHMVVGIDPVCANVKMNLFPNPATSQVKMNIEGVNGMVNCSIIDMSGRVVYNANVNAEQQQVINLSNMPAGAYFVRVTNNNFSKIEKLIIR